ncbi:uncharacterized protein LY89DRAFT_274087 [Mollisia scopiformis]|uniref:Uncharacterized protein n=1 Tax=Mollisia scopiformis TaxID=149040 RepID=A0A132BB11_MOLSC|nr:uncharacterized protein LY89DRAFT_274087 [Mollisia scopiformis]KUJ09610.1 hypothetical protein LY89DRAFT_274087 [Mollisia scopiformis]
MWEFCERRREIAECWAGLRSARMLMFAARVRLQSCHLAIPRLRSPAPPSEQLQPQQDGDSAALNLLNISTYFSIRNTNYDPPHPSLPNPRHRQPGRAGRNSSSNRRRRQTQPQRLHTLKDNWHSHLSLPPTHPHRRRRLLRSKPEAESETRREVEGDTRGRGEAYGAAGG